MVFRISLPDVFHGVHERFESRPGALVVGFNLGDILEVLLEFINMDMLCHFLRINTRQVEYALVGEEVGNCKVSQLIVITLQELEKRWNVLTLHEFQKQIVQFFLNGPVVAVLQKILFKEFAQLVPMDDVLGQQLVHFGFVLDGGPEQIFSACFSTEVF